VLITLRRRGQSIRIDNDIEIIVLEIQRNKVRIGIKAPQSMRINCSEIVLIQEQNAIASCPPAPVEATLREHFKGSPGASSLVLGKQFSMTSARSADAVGAQPATAQSDLGKSRDADRIG
jgi:carbon storage regulator CsrA